MSSGLSATPIRSLPATRQSSVLGHAIASCDVVSPSGRSSTFGAPQVPSAWVTTKGCPALVMPAAVHEPASGHAMEVTLVPAGPEPLGTGTCSTGA